MTEGSTQHEPQGEDEKMKLKCTNLKRRISEVEENNEIAMLALSRTKVAIRRLRLEYAILLERLEERSFKIPEGLSQFEEMASPPAPIVIDDSLVTAGLSRNSLLKKPVKKAKTAAGNLNGSSALAKLKLRDPDLPKRPTNAYLIFCEMEKERIKQENIEKNPGVVSDLSKSMTEAWKNLNEDDRKPYYKLYEDDRLRYQREKEVYKQKKLLEELELSRKKPVPIAPNGAPTILKAEEADIKMKEATTNNYQENVEETESYENYEGNGEPQSSQGVQIEKPEMTNL